MKDLVLSIMEDSEDVDFILSSDTAFDVALDIIEDGRVFEEMEEFEVIDEIQNSVAVILSQKLTDEGYIYMIENYLLDNGVAKVMGGADLVFIEDEIDDLVDMDKIDSDIAIAIISISEEQCDCECFEVGYEEGYNQALEDMCINTTCFTSADVIVIELKRRLPVESIKNIKNSIQRAFPNNEILMYCIDDFNLKIINKVK